MTLGEYAADYWWSAWCPTCRRDKDIFDFTPFLERYGPNMPWEDFLARLTCKDCGTRCPTGVGGAASHSRRQG